ncbi:SEC12-like protein 2 [Acorus calamus]|uniref:SEC12-like protein 2 n=1 Tax=Acorus calamus TaxID=4465 RepID=A0AAV9ELJ3_ACOCL|nr:SEC12-like protein 2 [Acorus calamus]
MVAAKSYGVPFYCAAWVPSDKMQSKESAVEQEEEEEKSPPPPSEEDVGGGRWRTEKLVVLGGGGGEGSSGIPNALFLARFDPSSDSLSEQPVHRLGTGDDVPYRLAVHPGGDGLICSFPKGCRWFEWDVPRDVESCNLGLRSSDKTLTQLENVGLQLALAFNTDGSMLASGGEDGYLRIFKWPSMETILDQSEAHDSVKNLHFSVDTKFLVSLGSSGPCKVWDLASATVVANLSKETGEIFSNCRFSQSTNNTLYLTTFRSERGNVMSWSSTSWKRVGLKQIAREPISAFSVSSDGRLLAVGTIEGDILILNSSNMRVQEAVKKAHRGVVTALEFSQDSSALVSSSFDYTARVMLIKDKKGTNNTWVLILLILLVILAYFLRTKGFPSSPLS